jgi:hypothetical protein
MRNGTVKHWLTSLADEGDLKHPSVPLEALPVEGIKDVWRLEATRVRVNGSSKERPTLIMPYIRVVSCRVLRVPLSLRNVIFLSVAAFILLWVFPDPL